LFVQTLALGAIMQPEITKITLSNGLMVLLKEIHTAPIISNWIWYRVGSKDEVAGKTGVSHWIEHMLFKGTPDYPASVLDKAISRDGGFWNAMTYLDWTTYFETMPADKIDLALKLEADRMVNSIFDQAEVEAERTVIISERQGYENEPLFQLGEEMQAAAFRVHAYHHEVIGDLVDLSTMQRENLYQHYKTFYQPNNAVLGIAGDFNTEEMLSRVRELFEPISNGYEINRMIRPEPIQNGERRVIVEGTGETCYIQIAHHIPESTHEDFLALTVLDSLLTGPSNLNVFGGGISNKTSRLYQALVDTELAISIQGGVHATIDPYMHIMTSIVHPQKKPKDVLNAIEEQLTSLHDTAPPIQEVDRAVKQARALFAYGSESITNQAFWLGFSEMFATYDWFLYCLDNLAKVTPADVQRVARKYLLSKNRVVGIYLPSSTSMEQSQ
jgi:zinc protease